MKTLIANTRFFAKNGGMESDAIFWDRLHDMPLIEAVQELQIRHEQLCLENAMLDAERNKINLNSSLRIKEHKRLGVAMRDNASKMTKLNNERKRLNALLDRGRWKDAVITLFGADAYEECAVWIEQQRQK